MDWLRNKFDWNRARAFLVTAEEGSLSAAARALGMAQPTLGRQVNALEQELEVVLFERIGNSLVLTPSGLELLEHIRVMNVAANKVALTAKGQSQNLEGTISISCTELYAALFLPPIVAKLRKLEPKIRIEIIATDSVSDLRRREADIAIRNFRPTQPELIAKKIKTESVRLYATPQYLDSIQNPTELKDLQRAEFINFDRTGALINGLNTLGLNLTEQNFPILSDNYLAHWQLVKQDLGIGIMPQELGDKDSDVTRVLADLAPIQYPVWLTSHRELRTSRRVRRVFDFLSDELSGA
ncbi:MAG: LysR family transcriptional regulator [Saccharospirillaceae bacterium]|nr:LysR family transcriptional regulator [Pseudomonadales bacterium]NRB77799.1 LysR family transcriptional regulator [Saccharospirillaceae bacterium]